MSDDLNARAARAMGWKSIRTSDVLGVVGMNPEGTPAKAPRYTTDANACRELLQEVERRKSRGEFVYQLSKLVGDTNKSIDLKDRIWTYMTLPLETIVRACVEVLEAE